MSVIDDAPAKEREAKQQLEFYGFWLWNYKYAILPSQDYRVTSESGLQWYLCEECKEYNQYKSCGLCHVCSEYNKIKFIEKTYQPWDCRLCTAKVRHQKRFTSNEIIFDVYRCKIFNSSFYDYSCAYKIKSNYVSIKILGESTEKETYYASSTILNVDMSISFPLEVINEDIARIKARASHSDKNGQIFCAEEAWDGAPHGICYTRLLSILKNFPDVSFQQQPAQRALGFWLWEQIDFLQNFKTVPSAIQYLRSGETLPPDILRRIGLDYPEYRQYNRLCQCTRKCVEQGEVLAIK